MSVVEQIPTPEQVWEINLCYSLVNESPSDETLTVAGPDDREKAIEWARLLSSNNHPEVRPTYRLSRPDPENIREANRQQKPVQFEEVERYLNSETEQ